MKGSTRTRVLIAEDDGDMRELLVHLLSQHPAIEVVGAAADGAELLELIPAAKPDVVTLDVFMPKLNGIDVLERVAGKCAAAFVMVSSYTRKYAGITLKAMELGAFDYVGKPKTGGNLAAFKQLLHEKVLNASTSRRGHGRSPAPAGASVPAIASRGYKDWVVAIGISCGGPQTLTRMLPLFPTEFAPILIVQHMPGAFTDTFAQRLDSLCHLKVREAADQDRPQPGTVLIAPGGKHMGLVRQGDKLVVRVKHGPKVSLHCPSADVLFNSVVEHCGSRAVGVIMTGMGSDGAAGITRLRQAGAWTIAQDRETSYVYGMPKAAIQAGGIDHVVPVQEIPLTIAKLMQCGDKEVSRRVRGRSAARMHAEA